MVVVGELNARLVARFTGFVERRGHTLPDVRLFSRFLVNPWIDQEFVANHVARVNRLGKLRLDRRVIDMG